ncbi:hypothetical protein T265_09872 [Opisthorchis viverrini]|uniref:Uncharacterized protein n=1 Tax=Opisthorchis viverrini TaxID=6198 RepID=A0A075A3D6_OPIVI|nr:hypothetical protein T265_09872 [Opisthorchis viverrini]KER21919.1 hypothetical protein T265_09872 [Opisthorchis viverrini]
MNLHKDAATVSFGNVRTYRTPLVVVRNSLHRIDAAVWVRRLKIWISTIENTTEHPGVQDVYKIHLSPQWLKIRPLIAADLTNAAETPMTYLEMTLDLSICSKYEMAQQVECEFTRRKVRDSNPTSASRSLLSRVGYNAVSQRSCLRRVTWKLSTEKVLQPNDFLFLFAAKRVTDMGKKI